MTQATFATHEVFNQSPPFEDVDLFALDRPLAEAVAANGGAAAEKELSEFGQHWGSAAMAARGRVANENTPKLRIFDPRGIRRDEVEFHPAYHELMARSAHAGVHNSTWTADGKPAGGAAEVVRAAKFYMAAGVETGHLCPITMTRASVAALGGAAGFAGEDDAGHRDPRLRSRFCAMVDKARHDARHGHDREAGRHRRALQHDARNAVTATPIPSPGINGSCRRRCATPFWCWRRPIDGLTCFFMPRFRAGWIGQRDPVPAPEGQARQPL